MNTNGDEDDQPALKKRKLVNGATSVQSQTQTQTQPRQVLLEARDISFSLPQRKKLHLGIAQYGSLAGSEKHTRPPSFTIFTRNPATSDVDMEVPLDRFAYALRLPVPEKAAKQYNFCLIPKSQAELKAELSKPNSTVEPIIWTIPHGPLKSYHISDPKLAKIVADSAADTDTKDEGGVLETALDYVLQQQQQPNPIRLTYPTAEEFASAKPESHRQGDKAYHVKAFRGSKDGYLFFLHTGIFFGFKKPLAFFAFEDIESISYTSVLQRTFNLNIAYRQQQQQQATATATATASNTNTHINPNNNNNHHIQEVEFSMLDQADFPGIDAYVKRHGLQDASLAESRRATKKANAAAAAAANGNENGNVASPAENGAEEDTRTELEKAQQQLEDEEDEEEEDYDPGSDGDSDGSGSDEDSDDDDNDAQQYTRERKKGGRQARDLVADELGSEAEDVSVTENEDDGDGGEHGEEGEYYDDGEEEEELGEEEPEPVQPKGKTGFAAVGQHQRAWEHDDGMPDPNDEDQL